MVVVSALKTRFYPGVKELQRLFPRWKTELPRFAELVGGSAANGRRPYRLTPDSLSAGRSSGMTLTALEIWFRQRTGQPLPAVARLLMTADQAEAPRLRRHLVLHVATEELTD